MVGLLPLEEGILVRIQVRQPSLRYVRGPRSVKIKLNNKMSTSNINAIDLINFSQSIAQLNLGYLGKNLNKKI